MISLCRKTRLAVIGNCQAGVLARILAFCHEAEVVMTIDSNLVEIETYHKALINAANDSAIDYVITQNNNEFELCGFKHQPARPDWMKKFIFVTNISFCGLQPDIVYVGDTKTKVQSVLADYNSRIVLSSFFKGLSPKECLLMFCHKTYLALNYYSYYNDALEQMRLHDELNDVRLSPVFDCLARSHRCMLTINHPSLTTLVVLARMLCQRVGIRSPLISTNALTACLETGQVWPIYKEIAKSAGLNYTADPLFYVKSSSKQESYTLYAFIVSCYDLYQKQQPHIRKFSPSGSAPFCLAEAL